MDQRVTSYRKSIQIECSPKNIWKDKAIVKRIQRKYIIKEEGDFPQHIADYYWIARFITVKLPPLFNLKVIPTSEYEKMNNKR